MTVLDNEKYYSLQEAAQIADFTIRGIKLRLEKYPESVRIIDTHIFVKAADLKEIIEGKKK